MNCSFSVWREKPCCQDSTKPHKPSCSGMVDEGVTAFEELTQASWAWLAV